MSFFKDPGATTKDCLNFGERPGTPPEIRKYRRSAYLEPGKRFQHHGIVDDLPAMGLSNKIYGEASDIGGATAQDLINHKKLSELEKMNLVRAEKVYRGAAREPLGRTVDRQIVLPSKFTEENKPFGLPSKSSLEPAKEIIFPTIPDDALAGEDLYKKSHGSFGPGEQKRRNYQWPGSVDPVSTVFGTKGDTIAFNGVSKNIAMVLNSGDDDRLINTKKVEDFRTTGDILGRSRNLGQGSSTRGFDVVYGKAKSKSQHTAAEVMKGRYSTADIFDDKDLGKSITPGFRNLTIESRAFGCPSIRSDLPARPRGNRSVADSQNYGDDVPAQDLINPPAFSDLSIPPTVMSEPRSKDNIIYTFKKIGYDLSPAISDVLFDIASQGQAKSSVNQFRDALNEYLDAVETGRESQWMQRYGVDFY